MLVCCEYVTNTAINILLAMAGDVIEEIIHKSRSSISFNTSINGSRHPMSSQRCRCSLDELYNKEKSIVHKYDAFTCSSL